MSYDFNDHADEAMRKREMSEELKCPCCGSEQSRETFIDRSEVWACGECLFQCPPKCLSRISAAMELAKATVILKNSIYSGNYDSVEDAQDQFADAEQRVLEVFK